MLDRVMRGRCGASWPTGKIMTNLLGIFAILICLETQTFVFDFQRNVQRVKHALSDDGLKIEMLLVYKGQSYPAKSHHRLQFLGKNV